MLDTNALSSMVRDASGPIAVRVSLIGQPLICKSLIVAAEVRYGLAKNPSARLAARVEVVLASLAVHAFCQPAEKIYGTLRAALEHRGETIGSNDLLIAAHALALDCILVTDNESEFRRVPGLNVENWLRSG